MFDPPLFPLRLARSRPCRGAHAPKGPLAAHVYVRIDAPACSSELRLVLYHAHSAQLSHPRARGLPRTRHATPRHGAQPDVWRPTIAGHVWTLPGRVRPDPHPTAATTARSRRWRRWRATPTPPAACPYLVTRALATTTSTDEPRSRRPTASIDRPTNDHRSGTRNQLLIHPPAALDELCVASLRLLTVRR